MDRIVKIESYSIRIIIICLAILGCADAMYLLFTKYQCSTCQTMHNSAWGRPFGIPIAFFGLSFYIAIMYMIVKAKEHLASVLATGGFIVSLFLVYVQLAILKSFCIFCLFSGILILSIWILLITAFNNQKYIKALLASVLIALVVFMVYYPLQNILDNNSLELASEVVDDKNLLNFNKQVVINQNMDEKIPNTNFASANQADKKLNSDESHMPEPSKLQDTHNEQYDVPTQAQMCQQTPSNLLTFYRADDSVISVDISNENVLFFSPSCDSCFELLAQISLIPEEKRPILIDTYIENDKETEISAVSLKLSQLSINSNSVLYDFAQHNPVRTIPTLIDSGM